MGFALERFAEAVDPAFECKLCGQVLEEPLCTPCGHVFCASCLLPWAVRRRRCPLQCQPLAPRELYRVLPLRSLIQKLRVQCDYRSRGCGHSAHVELCDFRPARHLRSRGGCASGPKSGEVPAREGCGPAPGAGWGGGARAGPPGGLCGRGRGPRPRKALLAQLWARQGEVQLTARKYQEKFTQYMAHICNFVGDLAFLASGSRYRYGERKVRGWGGGCVCDLESPVREPSSVVRPALRAPRQRLFPFFVEAAGPERHSWTAPFQTE
ncbi:PDZ domain-containing RING finger protein 4 [Saguinus oedipus]|uniref:PDZ domain-containing RING finger protein 4 n=1 Tax=Saguinus oedipus TaxID=9490 RepID=A0ABQ9UYB2_SAGOE|nr:PDZ domain-containing RING finger protein 4 [Saguinus oedipus]